MSSGPDPLIAIKAYHCFVLRPVVQFSASTKGRQEDTGKRSLVLSLAEICRRLTRCSAKIVGQKCP